MEYILQKPIMIIIIITTTLLTIIITSCLFKKIINKTTTNKKKKLLYHPVVGTILDQLRNFDRLHHYFAELAAKNKTYRFLSLLHSKVYTADLSEMEDLADENEIIGGKPFAVVSVNSATNVDLDEERAIEFLRGKTMNRDSAFTDHETIQTAIAAFQNLFKQEFKAEEIQVYVFKDM